MKGSDILRAVQGVEDVLLIQTAESAVICRYRKRQRTARQWAAAACICAAILALCILLPRPSEGVQEQSPTGPVYTGTKDPANFPTGVGRSMVIHLSGWEIPEQQKVSTYDPDRAYLCTEDGRKPVTAEEHHGNIEAPYYDDLRYVNGVYYVCVVMGYDPDYTHSACGGWHYEDAVLKEWHAVLPETGEIVSEKEQAEPGTDTAHTIFDSDGHYTNVYWSGAETDTKEGYFCRGDQETLTLWHTDMAGRETLIFTDEAYAGWGSVAAVGDGFVVYTADRLQGGRVVSSDYRVFDLEEGKVVLTLPFSGTETTYTVLFLHDGGLYCDSFGTYNSSHSVVRVDIATGVMAVIQTEVPTRNMSGVFCCEDYAVTEVAEGFSTEGMGGIYYWDLTGSGKMQKLDFPETCGGLLLSQFRLGTILDSRIFFSAVYAGERSGAASVLYCYDVPSRTLTEIWRVSEAVSKVLYAGDTYCALSPELLFCGKLTN